ncbi:hypothetical protein OnM2_096046 [Erysiphe neolycopersici]|uniref:Uncharacterized protein n=1 Tax=Erysiphe neolycopersici TaxID=212602 RepID=A0A420HB24_9PEZI|nr:hypothetical protein OnM2_096046 [Erysiphe neolycopersici]
MGKFMATVRRQRSSLFWVANQLELLPDFGADKADHFSNHDDTVDFNMELYEEDDFLEFRDELNDCDVWFGHEEVNSQEIEKAQIIAFMEKELSDTLDLTKRELVHKETVTRIVGDHK